MSNLLRHAEYAAKSQAIAERLAIAAKHALPMPAGATPAQISRRELLGPLSRTPQSPAMLLDEDEPNLELQRLGRYIAWRFGNPSGSAPGLPKDEVLNRNLEACEWRPEVWPALDDQMLAWLAFQRLVTFAYQGTSVDPSLAGMYPTIASRLSTGQRLQLLADVGFALEPQGEHVGVLLPFLYNDPHPAVAAYAAFLWAQREPVTSEDQMDGVRSVVGLANMLANAEVERPQAILAGLLALGDGRVLPALDGCWRQFPENQKNQLTDALFAPVTAAQLEWTLRWMEDSSDDDLGFGASALVNAADRGGDIPVIYDLQWHLPVPRVDHPDDPAWQYPWTVLQTWTFPQYAAILEPRLRRILLREQSEPIVPYVLAAWGLEPGEWDEIDQLRRIGERYLAHVQALHRGAEPRPEVDDHAWAWTQIATAVGGERPLAGLADLLVAVRRSAPDSRWVPVDPVPTNGHGEAALVRARSDALRRILRAQFGPNLSAALSDLALLARRWDELGLTGGF